MMAVKTEVLLLPLYIDFKINAHMGEIEKSILVNC
jgi:hypothetical protein